MNIKRGDLSSRLVLVSPDNQIKCAKLYILKYTGSHARCIEGLRYGREIKDKSGHLFILIWDYNWFLLIFSCSRIQPHGVHPKARDSGLLRFQYLLLTHQSCSESGTPLDTFSIRNVISPANPLPVSSRHNITSSSLTAALPVASTFHVVSQYQLNLSIRHFFPDGWPLKVYIHARGVN